MENNDNNGMLTFRNVIKTISIVCIVLFFCSSFLVSCSGKNIEVSGFNIVKGIQVDTGFGVEDVSDSKPIVLICLLIPIAIVVFMFLKQLKNKLVSCVGSILAIIDIVVWFFIKSKVKEAARTNNCEFKTTGVFVWTIVFQILTILIFCGVLIGRITLDSNLIGAFTGNFNLNSDQIREGTARVAEGTKQVSKRLSEIAGNVSSSVSDAIGSLRNKDDIMGYCQKCGAPLYFENEFCTSCGTPIPKDLIESAKAERERKEAERREAELQEKAQMEESRQENDVTNKETEPQFVFCPYCGTKQDGDSVYCVKCGKKM